MPNVVIPLLSLTLSCPDLRYPPKSHYPLGPAHQPSRHPPCQARHPLLLLPPFQRGLSESRGQFVRCRQGPGHITIISDAIKYL